MTYREWFDSEWVGAGEQKTFAIYRLSSSTGVSHCTVRKALAGRRVTASSAERLAAITKGAVSPVDLVFVQAA